ncbi:MAG TPA: LysE family translocator [Methylomirabilota bacterium]|nr:LysE family translocator [Methylomirabilota bacterium]
MTLTGLLLFSAAYATAVFSPGPGVAALVARVLARGLRGAPAFIAGFLIGDLVWFTVAATGLALLAQTFAMVFLVVKYAGAAYLLYLAWRLWTAPAAAGEIAAAAPSERPFRLFLGSLSLTLGNPKPIIFFLAILPTVVDLTRIDRGGFAEIAALMAVILTVILGGYALAAAYARRLFTSARAIRAVNRGTGAVMAGAAIAIAAR